MSISEQAKKLKVEAEWLEKDQEKRLASILLQAADTIESLAAKLQAANMDEENKHIKKHLKYGLCPDCGNAVGRGAITCFECGAILDWDLLKENDERSVEDCGGWIPCKERLPDVEASENVKSGICTDNGERFLITDTEGYVYESTFWLSTQEFEDDAIAWMPKPEPYHEP